MKISVHNSQPDEAEGLVVELEIRHMWGSHYEVYAGDPLSGWYGRSGQRLTHKKRIRVLNRHWRKK